MKSDYWDIDEFLAEEVPVTVLTSETLRQVGQTTAKSADLPADSKKVMPLWFGLLLARRSLGEIELPGYLDKSYLAAVQADPTTLNLREHTRYFFEVGATFAELLADTADMAMTLLKAFVLRVKYISNYIDSSHHPNVIRILTESEAKVLQQCKLSFKEYSDWKERKNERLCIAEVIQREHKRQRHGLWKSINA